MALHHRPAEPGDLPRCAELMRQHARLAYGPALADELPRFWRQLLDARDPALHVLVDDSRPGTQALRGLASGAFVDPDFLAQELAAPRAGLTQRVVELALQGRSPLLPRAALARAQAADGVHALGLDFALADDHFALPAALRWLPTMVASARDWLGGWRLASFHREVAGRDLALLARSAGVPLRRLDAPAGAPAARPLYLSGCTRVQAQRRTGSFMWWFFQHADPQLRFTPAEQDLLVLALRNLSDADAAARLHLSPHTVAMRWRSLLARASEHRPDLFPPHDGVSRGPERRSTLLAWLRQHPEELRPRAAPD
jgi:hypothetical protein